jgi:hypothetical protein
MIEHISSGDKLLAILVGRDHQPPATEFVTPSEQNLQVGFVKYPQGGVVQAHRHLPLERHIVGTNEVIVVRSGTVELALYDDDKALVTRRVLVPGDLVLLLGGGHGFRMVEDAVLMEIKQGPYSGLQEKERFTP